MKSFSTCLSITVKSVLDAGESSVWFTTLNLKSSYWQVEVGPEGQQGKKHAFTVGQGLWQFKTMAFG